MMILSFDVLLAQCPASKGTQALSSRVEKTVVNLLAIVFILRLDLIIFLEGHVI